MKPEQPKRQGLVYASLSQLLPTPQQERAALGKAEGG